MDPSSKGILISQHGSVFPWLTVQQNLMFGLNGHAPRNKEQIADHYAAMVGLKGFEMSYPHELSGGMLKRAELARALVVKPEILYMDEPFSALDALMSLRMRRELLRILAEERHTVVLITHDVEEAIHLADRVFVLSARPTRIQAIFEVPYATSAQALEPRGAEPQRGHPARTGRLSWRRTGARSAALAARQALAGWRSAARIPGTPGAAEFLLEVITDQAPYDLGGRYVLCSTGLLEYCLLARIDQHREARGTFFESEHFSVPQHLHARCMG